MLLGLEKRWASDVKVVRQILTLYLVLSNAGMLERVIFITNIMVVEQLHALLLTSPFIQTLHELLERFHEFHPIMFGIVGICRNLSQSGMFHSLSLCVLSF